jgi:hypothetical protein
MNNLHATSDLLNPNTSFVTGKELAKMLGVSTSAVSDAIKRDHHCGGQPICKWAEYSESGRVKGYYVPNYLLEGNEEKNSSQINNQPQKQEKRANPNEMEPDTSKSKLNSADQAPGGADKAKESPPPVTNIYKSLLPQGQDYSRTAGMVSLPLVLKKALDRDTAQSRVVISSTSGAIGAIIGSAATDSVAGAAVGAGIGYGGALLTYWFFDQKDQPRYQSQPPKQLSQKAPATGYVSETKKIEYEYV